MEFVKTGTLQQITTDKERKEEEINKRNEVTFNQKEYLKTLPEFQRTANFKSLSEQLRENQDKGAAEEALHAASFGVVPSTQEDELFFKQEEERKIRDRLKIKEEEDKELRIFDSKRKFVQVETKTSNNSTFEEEPTSALKDLVSPKDETSKRRRDHKGKEKEESKEEGPINFLIKKKNKSPKEDHNIFGVGNYDSD